MRGGLGLSSRVILDDTGGARDDTHCGPGVERKGLGESKKVSP